jgi:hypothetical protein
MHLLFHSVLAGAFGALVPAAEDSGGDGYFIQAA